MSTPTVALAEAIPGVVDATLKGAVELARVAAQDEAGPYVRVGEHLGVWPVAAHGGGKAAIHAFASTDAAYPDWFWAVEVVRVPRSKVASVDDVVLLPGTEAVLAPAWVPWAERLQPGDVGAGDILPTAADDPRLALTLGDTAGWVDDALWFELGLGRPRVLSAWGREDAAERWWEGDRGPDTAVAQAAPKTCDSCGFSVRLVGSLGRAFGVCANAMAPADGTVVALTYGCGAHSEAMVLPSTEPTPVVAPEPPDAVVEVSEVSGPVDEVAQVPEVESVLAAEAAEDA